MAEIGVILIMFSAGLGTNLKSLIKSGVNATVIAACGVLAPLILGTLMSIGFWGFDGFGTVKFYKAMFIGTILTATSVSITVAALKELGKIKTEVGQAIVSAAIIDDVFGIIVLTIILGVSTGSGGYLEVLLKTVLFFASAVVAGYIFGIADITGSYIAGVVFCSLNDAAYMEQKIDINSYMFFSPIFFAGIGLKTDLSGMNITLLLFAAAFVVVGCVSKIIGCGGVAKLLGYKDNEPRQIGLGMMVRGEVALIVAQKGLAVGMVKAEYFAPVILLIIVSSMIVPILLGKAFSEK